MPTSRGSRRPVPLDRVRRGTGLGLALVLSLPVLAACQRDDAREPVAAAPTEAAPDDVPAASATPSPQVPDVTGVDAPADLARDLTDLLKRRARALKQGDAAAYTSVLDRTAPGFVRDQQVYFDNLAQLPIIELDYTIRPASLVRSGSDYWVVVDVALRLDQFDDAAVHTFDRYRFSPTGPQGRFRLSSTTDRRWERAQGTPQQPWDLEPVQVVRRDGVLAVFDAGTAAYADEVVDAVGRQALEVATQVPYGWTGETVLYALSDDAFLDTLDVPGGDPATLDGLTFSLPVSPTDPTVATTRVVLQPVVLGQPAAERDRLIRHELTHLAVGPHDDGAPVWLTEGIAEYVSVRRQAPAQRRVSADALRAARAGVRTMPDDDTFNDADALVHYGIAWWAVEYLAATYGPDALWTVLDRLALPGDDVVDTTRQVTRYTPDQLARRGARLMVETYAAGRAGGGSAGPSAGGSGQGAGRGGAG